MSAIRVLFLGEIVGKAGVWCLKELLPGLKKQHAIDFTIADGEGATGGFGLGKNHSMYIRKIGVDVITMGECSYYKRDMVEHVAVSPWILRPANYPQRNPGRGFGIYEAAGRKIAVISLLGQANFRRVHLKNPFSTLPKVHDVVAPQTNTIIVDFHAVTTAEKNTMFWHADGKVSAIVGTHTKAPTADEHLMPGRTAVITDVGRVGSIDGVGGLDTEVETRKLTTLIHEYSRETWGRLELQAVVIDIGDDGLATGIRRIRERIDSPAQLPGAATLGSEAADAGQLIGARTESTMQAMGDGDIKWQEVLKDSVQNDSIRATHLRKIPHLKDCPAWSEASFIGRVVYKPQFGNYDGGLVKYAGRLYYINKAQIDALRPWVKWNTNKMLTVLEG